MKKVISFIILISILIVFGCFGESVKHLTFTNVELKQIEVTTEGDYKFFTVPNRDWKIKAYLPQYRVVKHDSAIFQATRHYDGEEMITVIASIIDPKTGVTDLKSCLEYRKRLIKDIEDRTILYENDRVIITKVGKNVKSITMLQCYDNVCLDTHILTSGIINQRAIENTSRIVESLQIIPH